MIVVSELAGNKAVIQAVELSAGAGLSLRSLGFVEQNGVYTRAVSGHPDRVLLIKELRSLGALFAGGPDWSPAELVEYHREQKMIDGPYQRIAWKSPEQYVIEGA